jgi:polypeptide N-acetylgalactosaminyltransferase
MNPPPEVAKRLKEEGFAAHKFNQYVSDRAPLRRTPPDVRHNACKSIHYDLSVLPKASVIVLFHNEARSTLLRTVWSVLDTSPAELLEEVVLIDDGSDMEWLLHGNLEAEARLISPKVKLVVCLFVRR